MHDLYYHLANTAYFRNSYSIATGIYMCYMYFDAV